MIRPLSALVLAVLLAGCSSVLEEKARRAPAEMTGMAAGQLKACAGEPTAINREAGVELWSYFRETSRAAATDSGFGNTPTGRSSVTYDYFRYCEAVFMISQGRVRAVDFRGRTSTGREVLEPCGAIVDRCVK